MAPKLADLRKPKTAQQAPDTEQREIVYPEPQVFIRSDFTAADAKELLGWEEETEAVKFSKGGYLLTDRHGKRCRCVANTRNRDFSLALAECWRQEMLRRRWQLNGETIILDKYGEIVSGQHRLIGLILAEQDRGLNESWSAEWPSPVSIPIILVVGIDDADDVVNTVDTAKRRELADVFFRSGHFAEKNTTDRRVISRIASWGLRVLWNRTQAGSNSFEPEFLQRSHAEAMDFWARHPRLKACVTHIFEENTGDRISTHISPGLAAGIMYLMGCSTTKDPSRYHELGASADESLLTWDCWSRAQDFWAEFAGGSESVSAVREAIANLAEGGTTAEKLAIVAKGWNAYWRNEAVSLSDVRLSYSKDEADISRLDELVTLGGIDLGESRRDPIEVVPSAQEIAQRKAEVDAAREKANAEAAKKPARGSKIGSSKSPTRPKKPERRAAKAEAEVEYIEFKNEQGDDCIAIAPKKKRPKRKKS